jgi:hypothetical protein
MWTDPLSADSQDLTRSLTLIRVRDATGLVCARLTIGHNRQAGTAICGELNIVDDTGGARQKIRALALLVREAYRYALSIGCTTATARNIPPKLVNFVQQMTGVQLEQVGDFYFIREMSMTALRDAANVATDPDGTFKSGDPVVPGVNDTTAPAVKPA